jgi:hypothetical protein
MNDGLPWLDTPTEPGWYWYRVNPSTVIRGPEYVMEITGPTTLLTSGRTYGPGLYVYNGEGMKLASHFQRSWAGPLPRPMDDEPMALEDDLTRKRQRKTRRNA